MWMNNRSSYLVRCAPPSDAIQGWPCIPSLFFYAMACETTILGNDALRAIVLRARRRRCRLCCRSRARLVCCKIFVQVDDDFVDIFLRAIRTASRHVIDVFSPLIRGLLSTENHPCGMTVKAVVYKLCFACVVGY